MSNINCSVTNCYHNDTAVCHANKVSINGKKSRTSTHTCCNSFVDTSHSSSLSNSVNDDNPCSSVACNVKTCTHNAGNLCVLNNISVASNNITASISSETYCSSFKCK